MSTSSQPPRNETPETGKSSSTSSTSDLPPDLLSAIQELYVAGTVTLIEAYKMKCYYMLEEEDAKDPGPQVLEEFRKSLPLADWDAKPTREGFIAIDKMKAERDRILSSVKEQSFMELRERTKRLVDGATKIVYKDNTFLDDSMTITVKVPNSFLRGMPVNDARRLVGMPPLPEMWPAEQIQTDLISREYGPRPTGDMAIDLPWPTHPNPEMVRYFKENPPIRMGRVTGMVDVEENDQGLTVNGKTNPFPSKPDHVHREEIQTTTSLYGGIRWGRRDDIPGSSPSTAGTTSTNTPASKEPSSSSTSSDLSDPESGPSPSSASPDETTGSC